MKNSASLRSTRLVDHLVHLSGQRRRDDLLIDITQALAETIAAQRVEIYGLVHDESKRFWLALTRADAGAPVRMLSDPMRTELHMMTPLDDAPERVQCLDRVERVASLHSQAALSEADAAAVTRLLAMYGNVLDMLDYSECDALTGLWNRKPFDDLFYKTLRPTEPVEPTPLPTIAEEHRATLSPSNFWLAMVDIDHFKQVNDTYGHLIGDEVLILVARLLKTSFRAYDRVYRFGGEEFVVVLRSDDHDAAVAAVERFRIAMANYEFPQAGRITASVGVTEIRAGDSPAAACERADQAVYYAKHHGRNQVCSEADLVRRGLLKVDLKVGDVELF
jgi:diguanylate cyclase (GGDEF)-like protein